LFSRPPLIRAPLLLSKSGLIKWVASFEKANLNLVVFYYPNASEIWPNKRSGLYWEGLDKKGYSIHIL